MIDAESGKDAESEAQYNDRSKNSRDHQADIGEHATSQHAHARSLKTARVTMASDLREGTWVGIDHCFLVDCRVEIGNHFGSPIPPFATLAESLED